MARLLPTAYVARREGYVLTRVCPSVCLSTPGGVPWPGPDGRGGTPARSSEGYPLGTPHQTWPGVSLLGGVPHLRYPPSDLAGRVPLPGGYPTSGTPHQIWPGGTPTGDTPPQVPHMRPGRGGGEVHLNWQMEYLIRRGRYASCVHAGGLSCLLL